MKKAFKSFEEDNKTLEFEKKLDNIFKKKDNINIFRIFMEYVFPRGILLDREIIFSYFE